MRNADSGLRNTDAVGTVSNILFRNRKSASAIQADLPYQICAPDQSQYADPGQHQCRRCRNTGRGCRVGYDHDLVLMLSREERDKLEVVWAVVIGLTEAVQSLKRTPAGSD